MPTGGGEKERRELEEKRVLLPCPIPSHPMPAMLIGKGRGILDEKKAILGQLCFLGDYTNTID